MDPNPGTFYYRARQMVSILAETLPKNRREIFPHPALSPGIEGEGKGVKA
jgi:hypothetical protein